MKKSMAVFLGLAAFCAPAMAQDEGLFGLGLIKQTDQTWANFISPMTNPVFFEDPRTLTEARFIFLNHHLPKNLFGNDVQLYALQIRAAITDDISIIATKDGYIDSHNPLMKDGWGDVSAGLKANLWKDEEMQAIVSSGFTFEMPIGSRRSLQGNGDGEFNVFLTGGIEFLPYWHYVSAGGFRLPVDTSDENQVFYWSHHVDKQIGDSGFYILGEANWYHYMSAGNTAIPVNGMDLINLGSNAVGGQDIVTGALGLKYKPSVNQEIGLAYEIPLSSQKDILLWRLSLDYIIRF